MKKMCFIVRSNFVTENGPYDDITDFFLKVMFWVSCEFFFVHSKIKYNGFEVLKLNAVTKSGDLW